MSWVLSPESYAPSRGNWHRIFALLMAARSFCTMVNTADGLLRVLAGVRSDVPSPSGGVIFVSGAASQDLESISSQVRTAWKGVPTCIVPAAGVLTERGEIEGAAAAS